MQLNCRAGSYAATIGVEHYSAFCGQRSQFTRVSVRELAMYIKSPGISIVGLGGTEPVVVDDMKFRHALGYRADRCEQRAVERHEIEDLNWNQSTAVDDEAVFKRWYVYCGNWKGANVVGRAIAKIINVEPDDDSIARLEIDPGIRSSPLGAYDLAGFQWWICVYK